MAIPSSQDPAWGKVKSLRISERRNHLSNTLLSGRLISAFAGQRPVLLLKPLLEVPVDYGMQEPLRAECLRVTDLAPQGTDPAPQG